MSQYCIKCGNELEENVKCCSKCGTNTDGEAAIQNNQNVNTANQEGKYNGQAIASFVVSLVGLIIFGLICGIISLSLGITALKHIKEFSNEKGKGLAIAGIVIGSIDLVFVLFGTIVNVITAL